MASISRIPLCFIQATCFMGFFIFFFILISPIILALLIHIFRDLRGKARNIRQKCYSCGRPVSMTEYRIISHHRGGRYIYCEQCADRHELWSSIAVSIMALGVATTLIVLSISEFDTSPQKSFLFAGLASAIVVIVVLVAARYISKKTK